MYTKEHKKNILSYLLHCVKNRHKVPNHVLLEQQKDRMILNKRIERERRKYRKYYSNVPSKNINHFEIELQPEPEPELDSAFEVDKFDPSYESYDEEIFETSIVDY